MSSRRARAGRLATQAAYSAPKPGVTAHVNDIHLGEPGHRIHTVGLVASVAKLKERPPER